VFVAERNITFILSLFELHNIVEPAAVFTAQPMPDHTHIYDAPTADDPTAASGAMRALIELSVMETDLPWHLNEDIARPTAAPLLPARIEYLACRVGETTTILDNLHPA
jgi:hypothetical protein